MLGPKPRLLRLKMKNQYSIIVPRAQDKRNIGLNENELPYQARDKNNEELLFGASYSTHLFVVRSVHVQGEETSKNWIYSGDLCSQED